MRACLLQWRNKFFKGYTPSPSPGKKGFFLFLFFCISSNLLLAQTSVTGRVSSGDTALFGASVVVKGTNVGTSTDVNGRFTIDAPSNGTLIISLVGYNTLEVKVNNRSSLDVQLESNSAQMEQ